MSTTISGIGGASIGSISHSVNFVLKSNDSEKSELNARALIVSKISDYVPKKFAMNSNLNHIQNLSLADPCPDSTDRIELLIGADLYGSILRDGIRHGPPGTPTAQLTIFGWVLLGPLSFSADQISLLRVHHAYSPPLEDCLQKFWSIEEPVFSKPLSQDEKDCEAHFEATHSRYPSGKYSVCYPFR